MRSVCRGQVAGLRGWNRYGALGARERSGRPAARYMADVDDPEEVNRAAALRLPVACKGDGGIWKKTFFRSKGFPLSFFCFDARGRMQVGIHVQVATKVTPFRVRDQERMDIFVFALSSCYICSIVVSFPCYFCIIVMVFFVFGHV